MPTIKTGRTEGCLTTKAVTDKPLSACSSSNACQAWALRRGAYLRGFDGTMYFLLGHVLGDYSAHLEISGCNVAQLPVTAQRENSAA
ncbi:hypothetical protein [Acidithiobacillus thiooxidans]|uniref:hypothetical protein n=1 Tax=Acidithiobacillus thiooxidans TaxID=930 RepID=UPI001153EB6A|nr:hypothetical protein [Acidithiobacillus thiooxidans]MDX5933165.1 hypothetical protein [Acidithiobacillus thiooxidans]